MKTLDSEQALNSVILLAEDLCTVIENYVIPGEKKFCVIFNGKIIEDIEFTFEEDLFFTELHSAIRLSLMGLFQLDILDPLSMTYLGINDTGPLLTIYVVQR